MASSDQGSSGAPKPVPGSYGLPVIGAVRDRLDFYYFQGQDKYFESRVEQHGSTVVRINVPPGPLNPRVVPLLDAKSFPVLFDVDKVKKRDVFTGTYMPSASLTGGYRVCAYLDPSEPTHAKVKQLLFSLLVSRKDAVVPAFRSNFSSLFAYSSRREASRTSTSSTTPPRSISSAMPTSACAPRRPTSAPAGRARRPSGCSYSSRRSPRSASPCSSRSRSSTRCHSRPSS